MREESRPKCLQFIVSISFFFYFGPLKGKCIVYINNDSWNILSVYNNGLHHIKFTQNG